MDLVIERLDSAARGAYIRIPDYAINAVPPDGGGEP